MDQETIDKSEINFSSREQCVVFMDELLRHKMFHRAKKIPVAEKSSKKDKKDKDKGIDNSSSLSLDTFLLFIDTQVYVFHIILFYIQ